VVGLFSKKKKKLIRTFFRESEEIKGMSIVGVNHPVYIRLSSMVVVTATAAAAAALIVLQYHRHNG